MATRTPTSSICGILVAILCIGVILAIVLTSVVQETFTGHDRDRRDTTATACATRPSTHFLISPSDGGQITEPEKKVFVDGLVTLRDTTTSANDIQYMNKDSTGEPVPRTCPNVKINTNTLENDALRCPPKRQMMIMNTAFEEKADIQTTKLNEIDQERTQVDTENARQAREIGARSDADAKPTGEFGDASLRQKQIDKLGVKLSSESAAFELMKDGCGDPVAGSVASPKQVNCWRKNMRGAYKAGPIAKALKDQQTLACSQCMPRIKEGDTLLDYYYTSCDDMCRHTNPNAIGGWCPRANWGNKCRRDTSTGKCRNQTPCCECITGKQCTIQSHVGAEPFSVDGQTAKFLPTGSAAAEWGISTEGNVTLLKQGGYYLSRSGMRVSVKVAPPGGPYTDETLHWRLEKASTPSTYYMRSLVDNYYLRRGEGYTVAMAKDKANAISFLISPDPNIVGGATSVVPAASKTRIPENVYRCQNPFPHLRHWQNDPKHALWCYKNPNGTGPGCNIDDATAPSGYTFGTNARFPSCSS